MVRIQFGILNCIQNLGEKLFLVCKVFCKLKYVYVIFIASAFNIRLKRQSRHFLYIYMKVNFVNINQLLVCINE